MDFIKQTDSLFPTLLREIPNPPAGIYVKGNVDALNDDLFKIAIVGTRRATPLGQTTAQKIATELARSGAVIVSGLAFGIDKAAHRGCLEGNGRTIAVLATGLDEIYPEQHLGLANDILNGGGAIISEYAPGTPSLPHQFLERNRLVSGLSQGVVVIEAPQKSGALSTAAHALQQNREVLVVPGAVNSSHYIGSHNLIKQGAALVTSASDVLAIFNIDQQPTQKLPLHFSPEQKVVFNAFSKIDGGLSVDNLCQITKLQPQAVNRLLSQLIIEGIINESGGKYFVA